MIDRNIFYVLLVAGTLACAGCSDGKIATNMVEGTVTLDGQPLDGAMVMFAPKKKDDGAQSAYALTDKSGRYVLQTNLGRANAGTTAGEYAVTFSKDVAEPTGQKETDSEGNTVDVTVAKQLLPETYTDPATTPFSKSVAKGKNVFDFELKSKP